MLKSKKIGIHRKTVQNEIKTVKPLLKAGEIGGKVMSKDLEAFVEGEIKNLEDELECPVCLEVTTTAPIYKCEDDHLICRFLTSIPPWKPIKVDSRQCRPKLQACPQCRVSFQGPYKRFQDESLDLTPILVF